jgi:hypothetical protein
MKKELSLNLCEAILKFDFHLIKSSKLTIKNIELNLMPLVRQLKYLLRVLNEILKINLLSSGFILLSDKKHISSFVSSYLKNSTVLQNFKVVKSNLLYLEKKFKLKKSKFKKYNIKLHIVLNSKHFSNFYSTMYGKGPFLISNISNNLQRKITDTYLIKNDLSEYTKTIFFLSFLEMFLIKRNNNVLTGDNSKV